MSDAASVLPNPHIRIRELEDALAPFADPRSWHFNYDGSGIIFQPEGDFYESQIEKRIDRAKEVMRHASTDA